MEKVLHIQVCKGPQRVNSVTHMLSVPLMLDQQKKAPYSTLFKATNFLHFKYFEPSSSLKI